MIQPDRISDGDGNGRLNPGDDLTHRAMLVHVGFMTFTIIMVNERPTVDGQEVWGAYDPESQTIEIFAGLQPERRVSVAFYELSRAFTDLTNFDHARDDAEFDAIDLHRYAGMLIATLGIETIQRIHHFATTGPDIEEHCE